jgi:hypothetical protein
MLPVLKTLTSTAWARGKGPKQIVKARSVAPAKAILVAFPQSLVWNSPGRRNYTVGLGRKSAAGGLLIQRGRYGADIPIVIDGHTLARRALIHPVGNASSMANRRARTSRLKTGAAKLKADRAARAEAEVVVDRWNRRLATGPPHAVVAYDPGRAAHRNALA